MLAFDGEALERIRIFKNRFLEGQLPTILTAKFAGNFQESPWSDSPAAAASTGCDAEDQCDQSYHSTESKADHDRSAGLDPLEENADDDMKTLPYDYDLDDFSCVAIEPPMQKDTYQSNKRIGQAGNQERKS